MYLYIKNRLNDELFLTLQLLSARGLYLIMTNNLTVQVHSHHFIPIVSTCKRPCFQSRLCKIKHQMTFDLKNAKHCCTLLLTFFNTCASWSLLSKCLCKPLLIFCSFLAYFLSIAFAIRLCLGWYCHKNELIFLKCPQTWRLIKWL